jgi:SOS response regulatory protein OraA/RecX
MKPTPRELQETYKTYESVVEHLIAEGYADDKESADKIIDGMSETWYNLIVND